MADNRWNEAALQLDADEIDTPPMPVHSFLPEALSSAKFLRDRWEPSPDLKIPGMKEAEKRVPLTMAEEIENLTASVQSAQTDILKDRSPDGRQAALVEEAREVGQELEDALEYCLDDGITEPADAQFAAAKARQADSESVPTEAQKLSDYAEIAASLGDRMADVPGFQFDWIPRARELALEIIKNGAPRVGRMASERVEWRDRLLTLLYRRVQLVRRTARYIFRKHPKHLQLIASTYRRNRRAEAARASLQAQQQPISN